MHVVKTPPQNVRFAVLNTHGVICTRATRDNSSIFSCTKIFKSSNIEPYILLPTDLLGKKTHTQTRHCRAFGLPWRRATSARRRPTSVASARSMRGLWRIAARWWIWTRLFGGKRDSVETPETGSVCCALKMVTLSIQCFFAALQLAVVRRKPVERGGSVVRIRVHL